MLFLHYATYAFMWCLLTVGNVKVSHRHSFTFLAFSTVLNLSWLGWLVYGSMTWPSYETSALDTLRTQMEAELLHGPFIRAVTGLLLWLTLIPQLIVCVTFCAAVLDQLTSCDDGFHAWRRSIWLLASFHASRA